MRIKIAITKSARNFGYLIWCTKNGRELEKLLNGKKSVCVNFNGFNLGEKRIDWKYHRISLGYKLTRAIPTEHSLYSVLFKDDILEVKSFNGNK